MGYKDIKFDKNSRFLITGGAGFIGSNITEALINEGYHVCVLDNLSTGHIENIKKFINNKKLKDRFEFIKDDIRNFNICLEATRNRDYVINLAAWGSVPRSIEMPLIYEEINIRGTLNMMEASHQNGVKRFIYASSSSVYGDSTTLPKREGEEGNILSPYALTNQDPNGDYAAVIPKFIKQLLNGERPTINGDGKQSRDFTYVDNVIEGCLRACHADESAAGTAYNIGAGGREYLIDVYKDICQALRVDVEPIFGPPRKGDIRDSNADISKAKKYLGYNPSYDFTEGIKLAIDWYKNNLR